MTARGCVSCGAQPARDDAQFCDACGSPLAPSADRAEFKQVTVLFADVVHSMDIAAAVGPERLREIMAELVDRAAAVVRRYGGTLDKFTGDGVMAVFGAPVALENHALQACRAALEIQAVIDDLVALRVGLNSGEVIAGGIGSGTVGYTAIGEQVGMAQRMESVAPPGGVMLSASTARLVENRARLAEAEMVAIKGAAESVPAYRLLDVPELGELTGRADKPLVGRQWEMAAVRGLLDNAIGGRGGVVGVVGPPGIGKSRLTREVARLATERGVEVVTAFCESHTSQVPFHLVSQLVSAGFGVANLEPQAARNRIREQVPGASEEDLRLLEDLIGIAEPNAVSPDIAADARRRRLTALINTASLARTYPVLFVVEDVHWIDEVSESMLADFLSVIARTPTLFVVTYRPEYRGSLATVPGMQTVALAPLSDSDTTTLVTRLLGSDPSTAALAATISERTAGNPFFAEEIVRELNQRGVLQGMHGAYRITMDASDIRVPATLQATIAARIDRLPTAAKQTLGAAAVIGARFEPELLAALQVDTRVDELLETQLVDQVQFTPNPVYAFHHPLIRTVAYESQLAATRTAMHRRLAAAVEDRGRGDEDAALVAEHLEAAGDLRVAYEWHMRAGGWAYNRSIESAHSSWGKARRIADELARSGEPNVSALRIAPRTLISGSAWRLAGSGADTGFEDLRQLCSEAEDLASLAVGMAGQVVTLFTKAERRAASVLTGELIDLLKLIDNPPLTATAVPVAGVAWLDTAEVDELLGLADIAINAAAGDLLMKGLLIPSPLALALVLRGNARIWLGMDGWRDDFAEGLRLCDDQAVAQAGIHYYISGLSLQQGVLTPDAALMRQSAEVLALAEQAGDNIALNMARSVRGIALIYAADGDSQHGLELLRQVEEDSLNNRYSVGALPPIECEFARSDATSGRLDEAVDRTRVVVEELHRLGGWAWSPFATRVLVDILLQRGNDTDLVEAQEAIDRFAAIRILDGTTLRDVNLLRMRALVSQANGDDTSYREYRDRYREMADNLGFEGHMQWAAEMP